MVGLTVKYIHRRGAMRPPTLETDTMQDPRTMKTKRERKEQAQDMLMSALSSAWYRVADDFDLDEGAKEALYADLEEQAQRIEKMFGFEPGGQRW